MRYHTLPPFNPVPKSISLLNAGYSASEYTPLLYVHDYKNKYTVLNVIFCPYEY